MIRTEDDLRSYYADTPDDLAAEQRLRALITTSRATALDDRWPRRRWLAVAASAATVAAVTVAVALTGTGGSNPAGHSSPSASLTAAPGTVLITPQVAVQTLIDLLPAGSKVSHLGGVTSAALISGRLRYSGPRGETDLNVGICYPRQVTAGLDDCTVQPIANATTSTLPDGAKLLVSAPRTSTRIGTGASMTSWQVALLRPDGAQITVIETPLQGSHQSRPPLSIDELKTIVTSDHWRMRVPAAVADHDKSLFTPTPMPTPGHTPSK